MIFITVKRQPAFVIAKLLCGKICNAPSLGTNQSAPAEKQLITSFFPSN